MSARNRSFDPTRRWLVAALTCLVLGLPLRVDAQSARLLDGPRAAGLVGERFDGYAVVRGAAPADVAALVDRVNAERKAVYEQRAAADKAPVDAVGKIYAQQIMQSAPAGTWLLGEDGQWTRK
jgi:uncharacterized protein YdbL (DUF1318 family)